GVAVRVTSVPVVKLPVQVVLQAIPVGLLITVPLPLPELVTLSVAIGGPMVKIWAAEVPPPGAGVTAVTWVVPAATRSPTAIAACTSLLRSEVAVRVAPVPCAKHPAPVLLPLIVGVMAAPPAVALLGVGALSVGAGGPMVKIWAAEVAPPGAGVTTVT